MKLKKTDVRYWRKEINKYARNDGNKTLVSLALSRIFSQFGMAERNRAIRDFNLDRYPFHFEIKTETKVVKEKNKSK